MARITVEDCIAHIPNYFELTLTAVYRARQLSQGHTPKVKKRRIKDKSTVIALREIAEAAIGIEILHKIPI